MMPLNRDQQQERDRISTAAYSAASRHARSFIGISLPEPNSPTTPEHSENVRTRRESVDSQLEPNSKSHTANFGTARDNVQKLKVQIKPGFPPKNPKSWQQLRPTTNKMEPPTQPHLTGLSNVQKSSVSDRGDKLPMLYSQRLAEFRNILGKCIRGHDKRGSVNVRR